MSRAPDLTFEQPTPEQIRDMLATAFRRWGLQVIEQTYSDTAMQMIGRVPKEMLSRWLVLVDHLLDPANASELRGIQVEVFEKHLWSGGHKKAWLIVCRNMPVHDIDQLKSVLMDLELPITPLTKVSLNAPANRHGAVQVRAVTAR